MDRNVHPHVTNAFLESERIKRIDWPARSPDLNPFDHAWDMLQHAVSASLVRHRTLLEPRDTFVGNGDCFTKSDTDSEYWHLACEGISFAL